MFLFKQVKLIDESVAFILLGNLVNFKRTWINDHSRHLVFSCEFHMKYSSVGCCLLRPGFTRAFQK